MFEDVWRLCHVFDFLQRPSAWRMVVLPRYAPSQSKTRSHQWDDMKLVNWYLIKQLSSLAFEPACIPRKLWHCWQWVQSQGYTAIILHAWADLGYYQCDNWLKQRHGTRIFFYCRWYILSIHEWIMLLTPQWLSHTVDGRNPAPPAGWLKPMNNGINHDNPPINWWFGFLPP